MTAGLQEVDASATRNISAARSNSPPLRTKNHADLWRSPLNHKNQGLRYPSNCAPPPQRIYTRIPALAAVTFQWSPSSPPNSHPVSSDPGTRSTTRRTPTSKQFGSERQTSLRPRVQRRPSGCLVIPGTATNRGAIRPLLVAKSQRHVQRRCEQPLLIIRVEGSRPLHGWLHCARFTRSFRP